MLPLPSDLPPPPAIVDVLLAPDGNSGDELGHSVAVSGPLVAGGRWLADPGGLTNAGAARIWRRTAQGSMVAEGEVVAPDAAPHDEFGVSVALESTCDLGRESDLESWPRLVVGAWTADLPGKVDAGSAYVFRRNPANAAWELEAKLVASDSATGSEFGRAVAIDDDLLVVGAWEHQASRGALYVFRRIGTAWTEEAKLLASDGTFGDGLGVSVAIDGDRVLGGAWGDDVGASSNQGAAYVFRRNAPSAWVQEAKLVALDASGSQEFGRGVALDGSTAVIGTWPFFVDGPGSAYVFQRSGTSWSQQAKLLHPAPGAADYFGFSVGVSGDVAIVGAWADDVAGVTNQGTAHVFRRDRAVLENGGWVHWTELVREESEPSAYFGFSVAIDGAMAAVGSRLDDVGGNTNQGSVAVVCIDVLQCNNCPRPSLPEDLDGDGVVDGADLGALLSAWGRCGGCPADLNGDGAVDGADLGILLGAWMG